MGSPTPSGRRSRLPWRRSRPAAARSTEPPFDPTSWTGALIVMCVFVALLWGIAIANDVQDFRLNRFGVRPRQTDGLWGILAQPFLHQNYGHLLSNTVPLLAIGWTLLLSGVRVFLFVTAFVVIVGDAATWLIAPSGQVIVGASGLVFGWLGYLLARALFSRRLKWIFVAVALLVFFGTLFGNLLPTVDTRVPWVSHLTGLLAGGLVGWLLHPTRAARPAVARPVGPGRAAAPNLAPPRPATAASEPSPRPAPAPPAAPRSEHDHIAAKAARATWAAQRSLSSVQARLRRPKE